MVRPLVLFPRSDCPSKVDALSTPFTGLKSLPAIVIGTSMAGLLCPLHLLHHVCVSGVDYYCPLSPPRHLFGLRLVFPFEYLQRLHDSMIGPALVQRWVLHDPWTYEPSRAMPYPEVHHLHWCLSPFSPSFSRYDCLGIYFAFISVPDCFFCSGIGHFFSGCFGL